jgi:hypothetical protein
MVRAAELALPAFTGYGQKAVRRVMRFTPMPLLLLAVRALCRLRLLGRQYAAAPPWRRKTTAA